MAGLFTELRRSHAGSIIARKAAEEYLSKTRGTAEENAAAVREYRQTISRLVDVGLLYGRKFGFSFLKYSSVAFLPAPDIPLFESMIIDEISASLCLMAGAQPKMTDVG